MVDATKAQQRQACKSDLGNVVVASQHQRPYARTSRLHVFIHINIYNFPELGNSMPPQ